MKYRALILTFSLPLMTIFAFKGLEEVPETLPVTEATLETTQETDWPSCLVKYKSEWGGPCKSYGNSEDKYTIFLKNQCEEAIDVMVCLQHTNKNWECYFRYDLVKDDEFKASVCKGVGKYLKWVRKAGDAKTLFPTEEEVNASYE